MASKTRIVPGGTEKKAQEIGPGKCAPEGQMLAAQLARIGDDDTRNRALLRAMGAIGDLVYDADVVRDADHVYWKESLERMSALVASLSSHQRDALMGEWRWLLRRELEISWRRKSGQRAPASREERPRTADVIALFPRHT